MSQILWGKFSFFLKKHSESVDIRMFEISKARLKVLYILFPQTNIFCSVMVKRHCSESKLIGEDKSNFLTEYSKVVFAPSAGYQTIFTRTSILKNTCLDLQDLHLILYVNKLI